MLKLTDTQDRVVEFVLLIAFFLMIRTLYAVPPSDDLRALWMAGRFFSEGADSVYAISDGVFRMTPPPIWIETYIAEGIERPAYPFIYPPLWAWAVSQLTNVMTFETFRGAFAILNAAAMCGCFYLASRMARGALPRTAYMAISLLLVLGLGSMVAVLPLSENQPQILVSFLILLAIERDRAGRPWIGGACMAVAAALKLYPVLFAIFWLAAGKKHAPAAFTLVGATLGLASLAVGGWGMHLIFLSEVSAISNNVLVLMPNVTLDVLVASLTLDLPNLPRVSTEATGGITSWSVFTKPVWWTIMNTALQATVVGLCVVHVIRNGLEDVAIWPVIFVALAYVLPLSWIYHYLPAFAFLPALVSRLGWRAGTYVAFIPAITTSSAFFLFLNAYPAAKIASTFVLSVGVLTIAAGFLWALRRIN